MNVLSLFDGMSCGMLALKKAGIPVFKYYASEIDKYAQIVSHANFPEIERLGDVTLWDFWNIDWASIDLVLAGSPCQGFSFAGKQLAFNDPRSALFFKFVDILSYVKKQNPKVKFLLENVRMKKEHLQIITDHIGVDPVYIDSALVCAQSRKRWYWCNWGVGQPEDRGIVLADILESGFVDREKSLAVTCSVHSGASLSRYINKNMHQIVFHSDEYFKDHILSEKALARATNPNKKFSRPRIMPEKTGTLTTRNNSGQLGLDSGTNLVSVEGVEAVQYRKLTPVECERLQGAPDNYTNHVSNTQRYKMLGNGWQIDTISHIFDCMKNNPV